MRRHPKAGLAAVAVLLCLLVIPAAAAADTLPTTSGEAASEIGVTTVKLSGDVNPNGTAGDGNTTWRLQYSPAGQDAWSTVNEAAIEPPASEEANPVTVEAVFGFGGELAPGETYEFRLQAENGAGLAETATPYPTFTMDSATAPALVAEAASAVSITSAHLKGTVDPEGGNVNPFGPEVMPIYWELQTSTDGSSWNTAGSGEISGAEAEGSSPITVEVDATGLVAATEYQVRLHAYSTNFGSFNVEADSPEPNPTFNTEPATAPTLVLDPPSAVTSDSAHLAGAVDPEGGNVDGLQGTLPIAWELQVQPEGGDWSTVGSGELTGAEAEGTDPIVVEADPTGLEPNTEYSARLLVTYAGVQKPSGEEPFTTEAIAADISRETLWEPTSTSIQLNAQVNPHNAVLTDCHFEYGANGALNQTAPCESPFDGTAYTSPENNSDNVVSARVSGLTPSTEYSFRLVVTSSVGTTEGDVRSFTTLEAAAPEGCSNTGIRSAQKSTHLPDCRAYEMVSPLNKGFGDLVAEGGTTIPSAEGDGVVFNSRTPFGDTVGAGVSGQTQYLARRGADGWTTHAITPMPRADALQTIFAPTILQIYSEDLRRGVVWGYDLPGGGGTPDRNNIYLEDTSNRALQPVTISQADALAASDFRSQWNLGLSADARHITFMAKTRLLPEAASGKHNVYQWNDGVLTLASILPDGSPVLDAATVFPKNYRGAMSVDGSRQLFSAPVFNNGSATLMPNSQLYQRIDGDRTIWISEPEGSDDSTPQEVALEGATPDGRGVVFSTTSRLLDEDENDGRDLYRFIDGPDPENEENLTLISNKGNLSNILLANSGASVVGLTDDAEQIYYSTPDSRLTVWNRGTRRTISSSFISTSIPNFRIHLTSSTPGLGRVSPDGNYVAFVSRSSGGAIGLTGSVTNDHLEMYLYSFNNDTLDCLSCPEGPAASDASVVAEVTNGSPVIENVGFRPRFLAAEGKVFFSTRESLLSQDVNGTLDAYQFDPASGTTSLLSTGRGSDPASFANASLSGDDVFILTRQRLDSHDTDDLVDLYDVRVGGGFPPLTLPSSPCMGEACQSPAAASPSAPSVSSSARARGNLKHRRQKPRCSKAKRRAGRCGKHHHKSRNRGLK